MSEVTDLATHRLQMKNFELAEYGRSVFLATVDSKTPYEAILEPNYWAHVAQKIRPRSKIEVMREDGAWYAELLVLYADTKSVKVVELFRKDLQTLVIDVPQTHKIEWAGPVHKWRIVRIEDKEVIRHGFQSQETAGQFLREHLKAMAA